MTSSNWEGLKDGEAKAGLTMAATSSPRRSVKSSGGGHELEGYRVIGKLLEFDSGPRGIEVAREGSGGLVGRALRDEGEAEGRRTRLFVEGEARGADHANFRGGEESALGPTNGDLGAAR